MRRIGILLFDGVEVLDATGPFEVFSVAARLALRESADAPFKVITVADPLRVRARHGLELVASHATHAIQSLDVLVVPGGVIDAPMADGPLLGWIGRHAEHCEIVASVCTGAFLLAVLGLLNAKAATTHWEDMDEFRDRFPAVRLTNARWTEDHGIWTSAGISAGIDMCLQIVSTLEGEALALRTARQMEYRWERSDASRAGSH